MQKVEAVTKEQDASDDRRYPNKSTRQKRRLMAAAVQRRTRPPGFFDYIFGTSSGG